MGVLNSFVRMHSIREAKIGLGQTVLLRSDFDVPLKDGKIVDDFRLKAALPTIKFLLKKGAKITIISHLGRPGGKVIETLRLDPVAQWLRKKLGASNQIRLLENLRFSPGEEKNDPDFAKKLASLGEIFVNDAFTVCHRRHASIVGIPRLLPSFAGLRLKKEVEGLKKALKSKKDLVVILGGAKTETKIPVIKNLVKLGAVVLLGGVAGNTFLSVFLGRKRMGGAIVKERDIKLAKRFLKTLDKPISFSRIPGKTTKIWLPLDLWAATEKIPPKVIILAEPYNESVPKDFQIYGLGPKTLKEYAGLISQAKVVVWNGPISRPHPIKTPKSTEELGKAVIKSKVFSIVGGGETVAALAKEKILDKIDLVSAGGGAMLEFLSKGSLPGIEVLRK